MTENPRQDFLFLDGLRGIAALQVVFLHYLSAFLPVSADAGSPAHYDWERAAAHSIFSYIWDGYSAVYIFFIMSGFVLAQSFIRSDLSAPRTVAKRFARLFFPVAIAAAIAATLHPVINHFKLAAVSISGSEWLTNVFHNPMSLRSVAKDIFFSSMAVGYDGVSILQSALSPYLQSIYSPTNFALNPPMWTLHGELWGSMLVLFLANIYKRLPPIWSGAIIALVFVWVGTSQLSLFAIGFSLYLGREKLLACRNWKHVVLSVALLCLGVWICVRRDLPAVLQLDIWLVNHSDLRAYNDAHFQSSLGALLVLVAVIINPHFRKLLSSKMTNELGRLSFSIYILHFPIMLTLGCAIFSKLAPYNYLIGCAISIVIGTATTIVCAHFYERHIDRASIKLANRLSRIRSPFEWRPGSGEMDGSK
ncbi:acyltransferase family protein [Burkholderia dolosa]|uniref:acyltransferase family protein n=1 Tax=Burkholderia dolosa TaxID=152500 RepID=UPI001591CFC6|nr:acyltransferase [Burkholderia dolosa]MBY4751907.1 acyltransferase [Burkholderia dolosa]